MLPKATGLPDWLSTEVSLAPEGQDREGSRAEHC